ncbi:MAG: GNAT family N-acetyltransferase [Acetobacteraceae bacterium]
MSTATIRTGRDADAEGLIELIGACWAEYPGCVMDVDAEAPELRALATYMRERNGALWAAEANGRVVGTIATYPEDLGTWAISRMYVDRAHRGTGLANRLLDAAEARAIADGAARLALWTDTRFERAHRFYERRSYVRSGPIRSLDDLSKTIEFHYAKPVAGIEVLGPAGMASAEARLAEILRACVDAGASVSFFPPLAPMVARGFWRRATQAVATGERVVLGAWAAGVLVGTATLDMATPPNQPHRADVSKLLVHPDARRHGLARGLMARIEDEARRAKRPLLTLDTQAGSSAERLYRSAGWCEAGRIPGYALDVDRTECATVIFYKRFST